MIRKTTWIFLAVFVGLGLLTFILSRREEIKSTTPTPTSPPALLAEISLGNIEKFRLEDDSGKNEVISQIEEGNWEYEDPKLDNIDLEAVEMIVNDLIDLRILAQPIPPPNTNDVGLERPRYILTLYLADGNQVEYKIGDITPTESGYYILDGEGNILVVSKLSLESVINLLDNPPTLTITPETLSTNQP